MKKSTHRNALQKEADSGKEYILSNQRSLIDEHNNNLDPRRFLAQSKVLTGKTSFARKPFGASDEQFVVEVEYGPKFVASNLNSPLGAVDARTAAIGTLRGLLSESLKGSLVTIDPVFTNDQIVSEQIRLREFPSGALRFSGHDSVLNVPERWKFLRLRFRDARSKNKIVAELKKIPGVKQAEIVPDFAPPTEQELKPVTDPLAKGNGFAITTDPTTKLETQWYLHRAKVPLAWRFGYGAGVVLADIDWGFRVSHQDIKSGIDVTYNSLDGSKDVGAGDQCAHGTAVLGIAGARMNTLGMVGFAPEVAIWAIQANSARGTAQFTDPWLEGIDFVRRTDSKGRRKIILVELQTSAGGNCEQVPSINREIKAAISDGCVVCVAAGNGDRRADRSDTNQRFDPTGSVLVGATVFDSDEKVNKRAGFSNYASSVVISAPGDPDHDLSCGESADNSYVNKFGGTSGAAPKVAGTIALMLSVNSALTHEDVREILSETGSKITDAGRKPIGSFLNSEAAVVEAHRRMGQDVITPAVVAAIET